jgi:hypothetical protein
MAVDPFRIRGRACRLSALRGDPLLVKAGLQRRPIDGCISSSLYVQTGVPSGNGYTIPSDGVIASWSYQVGNAAIIGFKLEVAGPESAGSRTTVGQAAAGAQRVTAP